MKRNISAHQQRTEIRQFLITKIMHTVFQKCHLNFFNRLHSLDILLKCRSARNTIFRCARNFLVLLSYVPVTAVKLMQTQLKLKYF
jgi:hypothetical protein